MENVMEYKKFNKSETVDTMEIAKLMCSMADETIADNPEILNDCELGIYQIKAMAQNPMNCSFWRVLYNVMCQMTENAEV